MSVRTWLVVGLLLASPMAMAQSVFDGKWRPDPEKPSHPGKPEVYGLSHGIYECRPCEPPYTIRADGHDQPIAGSPYYNTVSVAIIDDHSIRKIAKKDGKIQSDTTVKVSPDGSTKTEVQTVTFMGPVPVEMTGQYVRVSAGPPGSHLTAGGWQVTEMGVSNNVEDTIFKVSHDTLSMSDAMGRSFSAKLDGTDAPYKGSGEFNSVSLRMVDAHTIEESDKKNGVVVKINRWTVDPDGKTMRARFDDTHGQIQTQSGHKVQ
jgi:hypothetical protein